MKDVRTGLLRDGSNATCGQALMWVVHFLGDIAQPLHASGLGAGGNTVNVTFGGQETELHAVSYVSQGQYCGLLILVLYRFGTGSFSTPLRRFLSSQRRN